MAGKTIIRNAVKLLREEFPNFEDDALTETVSDALDRYVEDQEEQPTLEQLVDNIREEASSKAEEAIDDAVGMNSALHLMDALLASAFPDKRDAVMAIIEAKQAKAA